MKGDQLIVVSQRDMMRRFRMNLMLMTLLLTIRAIQLQIKNENVVQYSQTLLSRKVKIFSESILITMSLRQLRRTNMKMSRWMKMNMKKRIVKKERRKFLAKISKNNQFSSFMSRVNLKEVILLTWIIM
jgi:membrane-bound acyltransferase YfiQ involved in biofilm formation